MAKQVQALIVPDGGPGEVRTIEPDLDTLQSIVGGWLEAVNGAEWHVYVDEEGKIKRRSYNAVATTLARVLGWRSHDILVGPAVFLGNDPDDSAEEGDVPAFVIEAWAAIRG